MATGGKLSGYGGGDRINALLEAGEFVIRKEAVRRYGAGLFQALNAMKYDFNDRIRARLGGMMSNISLPAMPTSPLAFQAGGGVPFAGKPTESMTLRFQAGNVDMPITAQGPVGVTRRMVKQFERELIKMGMVKRGAYLKNRRYCGSSDGKARKQTIPKTITPNSPPVSTISIGASLLALTRFTIPKIVPNPNIKAIQKNLVELAHKGIAPPRAVVAGPEIIERSRSPMLVKPAKKAVAHSTMPPNEAVDQ